MTLYLEPWGQQYTMAPEATFTAVARGPEGDTLEVEVSDNHIILYGWPGAVVTLFHEGKEIGDWGLCVCPGPVYAPPSLITGSKLVVGSM